MSRLALKYLCPPASSSASEREFSVTGLILTPKRNRLLPNNLEQLLFLKYNLRATEYSTNLPQPPPEFKGVNTLLVPVDDETNDTDPDADIDANSERDSDSDFDLDSDIDISDDD